MASTSRSSATWNSVALLALLAVAGAGSARAELASAVTAGASHTCARTMAGGVQCWGANGDGQLGNGRTVDRSVAIPVTGLTSGVAAVAAGGRHTCALTLAGGLSCWGYNQHGQLGDGTTTNSSIPIAVSGATSEVAAIATGSHHACALGTDGGVRCWGLNASGQLGSGSTTISSLPLAVTGLSSGVGAIAAGGFHTCALLSNGEVRCWGLGENGQLGNGAAADSSVPVEVSGLSNGAAAVAAGAYHSCALATQGGVECWGFNESGQLGNGTTSDSSVPVPVTGLASVEAVAAGDYHTCALGSDGGVVCWGSNDSGQLGEGTTSNSSIPVPVTGLASGVEAIAAGRFHTCAVVTGGAVLCWGNNFAGQLGNGTTISSSVPVVASVPVPALEAPAFGLLAAALGLVGARSLVSRGGREERSPTRTSRIPAPER